MVFFFFLVRGVRVTVLWRRLCMKFEVLPRSGDGRWIACVLSIRGDEGRMRMVAGLGGEYAICLVGLVWHLSVLSKVFKGRGWCYMTRSPDMDGWWWMNEILCCRVYRRGKYLPMNSNSLHDRDTIISLEAQAGEGIGSCSTPPSRTTLFE